MLHSGELIPTHFGYEFSWDSLPDCLLGLVAYLISKRINEDK